MDEQERQAQQAAQVTGITEGREILETLRLHEERAEVQVVREGLGSVVIRRIVTERQEVVPITLSSEHLEITVTDGSTGRITMNGEPLEIGQTYEVKLTEERALIEKRVYPLHDVAIAKQAEMTTQTETITLRREELEVEDPQHLVRDMPPTEENR